MPKKTKKKLPKITDDQLVKLKGWPPGIGEAHELILMRWFSQPQQTASIKKLRSALRAKPRITVTYPDVWVRHVIRQAILRGDASLV
jgi:hypothetical protein